MAASKLDALFILMMISYSTASNVKFIDDVYSSNDIYLAFSVSANIEEPKVLQYTECGKDDWKSIPIHDASERYQRNITLSNEYIYSMTLNNLIPDTVYQIKILPYSDTTYRVRTLSSNDDWQFYLKKVAPYAVGAVGAVILAPVALEILGFGSVGITAGSAAAGIQSGIGLVESGSIFAMLQSAGMAGISAETSIGLALGGAGIVGGVSEVIEDECDNTDYIEFLRNKFKNIQHFVVGKIDEMHIDSVKTKIVDYMEDVIAIHDLRKSVKTKYDRIERNIVDKIHFNANIDHGENDNNSGTSDTSLLSPHSVNILNKQRYNKNKHGIDTINKYPKAPYIYIIIGLVICMILVVFALVTFIMQCVKMIVNEGNIKRRYGENSYGKTKYIDSDDDDVSDLIEYEDIINDQIR